MMLRTRVLCKGFFGMSMGKDKDNFFTSIWNKPETKDERVNEYVPEVLEESLREQHAVMEESTSRDIIVELGHKVLSEMQNKSPTPSISPHLNKLLQQYGVKDVIAQRPLSYLLYPNSSALSGGELPHDLVSSFPDNFRSMIDEVETGGCSAVSREPNANDAKGGDDGKVQSDEEGASSVVGAPPSSGKVIVAKAGEHEPMDITMFVKIITAMSLANLHCGDVRNAIRCVDAGIAHAIDAKRLGGLLGMKAGLLVREQRYEEAAEIALLAVEASGNIQGYIHGSFALSRLNRLSEVVELLEKGKEDHPMNTDIFNQLEAAKKEVKLSLSE